MTKDTELAWQSTCCRKGCPAIATDAGHVLLRDDYGNCVRIRYDQVTGVIETLTGVAAYLPLIKKAEEPK